jgi:two-component system sensor histidine kinase UhpB
MSNSRRSLISTWPALRTLVAPVAAAAHLETRVSIDAGAARLPADIETIAYRVAQEALTNVVACRPRFVTVDVRLGAGRVRRQIADDGRGVGAVRGEGYGIIRMRERAALRAGKLEITPGPRGGTRVTLELPLG